MKIEGTYDDFGTRNSEDGVIMSSNRVINLGFGIGGGGHRGEELRSRPMLE